MMAFLMGLRVCRVAVFRVPVLYEVVYPRQGQLTLGVTPLSAVRCKGLLLLVPIATARQVSPVQLLTSPRVRSLVGVLTVEGFEPLPDSSWPPHLTPVRLPPRLSAALLSLGFGHCRLTANIVAIVPIPST
jgi:hypothetical protein